MLFISPELQISDCPLHQVIPGSVPSLSLFLEIDRIDRPSNFWIYGLGPVNDQLWNPVVKSTGRICEPAHRQHW